MFLDEKIKEYIKNEKNGWLDIRKTFQEIEKLKDQQKELDRYLLTYKDDFLHQEMNANFNKVLDNIEILAKTFDLKLGIELAIFSSILIHGGYLTISDVFLYKKGITDIKKTNDKNLYLALKIFTGEGNCRHIASFTKKVLDRFNIENSIACLDNSSNDYNINEIRMFLHNIHKTISPDSNHVINYIKDNNINYLLDITSTQPYLFGIKKQFAYSMDGYQFHFPIYSYDYSLFEDEFIDYSKVPQLTENESNLLIDIANATTEKLDKNGDLLLEFYFQNVDTYRRINENYNKVYKKEKSLKLI